jgi:hypothetical protein
MKDILKKKIYYSALGVSILLFLLMYLLIASYYHLAADDYSVIGLVNENGIIGTSNIIYFTWSGNYIIVLIASSIFYFLQYDNFTFFYFLVLILLLFHSSTFLIKQLCIFYTLSINKYEIFSISSIFLIALFYSGIDITQNWFWIDGSIVYIVPIISLFYFLAFFIRLNFRNSIFDYFILFLTGFTFGNSTPNYVFIFMITFAVFTKMNLKIIFRKKIIIIILPILLGLMFDIVSPGNYHRKELEELANSHSLKPLFFDELYNSQIWTIKHFFEKVLYIIPFSLFLSYLIKDKLLNVNVKKIFFNLLLSFILSSIVNSILMIYAVGWGIHERTMMLLQILYLFMVCSIIFLIVEKINKNALFYLSFTSLLLFIYLSFRTLQIQLPIVKEYSISCEKRLNKINELKKLSNTRKHLFLQELSNSGILFTSEIDIDTNYYINVDMKKALKLNFSISKIHK